MGRRPASSGTCRILRHVGFDETGWKDDGRRTHANVAQSGRDIAISISASSAILMPDGMEGVAGV